jgi:hypothetical protein
MLNTHWKLVSIEIIHTVPTHVQSSKCVVFVRVCDGVTRVPAAKDVLIAADRLTNINLAVDICSYMATIQSSKVHNSTNLTIGRWNVSNNNFLVTES